MAEFRFLFTVTDQRKRVVAIYQGILPVDNEEGLKGFAAAFRKLILDHEPLIKPRKPPKGTVRIKKTAQS
jgi:hypothetical protein